MTTTENPPVEPRHVERVAEAFEAIALAVGTVVRGKDDVIRSALICLLSGGHLLVEDVPGVGKTTLAKAIARATGLELGRIQFTPDLLPSDVTGVAVWNRSTGNFEFRPGPVFSRVVLADEINRASPKTQSALLEAMAEGQVTADGTSHELPNPHFVVATQNPIEQEGTYPLPESQLDRFLMKVTVGYPDRDDERSILETHETDGLVDQLKPVADVDDIATMSRIAGSVPISDALRDYLLDLAESSRRHHAVALGMSPRATLALQRASRVRAASLGRNYVTDDDIRSLLSKVISHRLILQPEAQLQGLTPEQVVDELLRAVPVPRDRR